MPFKIVKTTENGKEQLTIVPSLWEKRGILKWPGKNVSLKLLIQNEYSKPLPDWKQLMCTVKRSCMTYAKAEEELNIMLNYSDTSDHHDDEIMRDSPLFNRSDFNAFADNLIQQTHNENDAGSKNKENVKCIQKENSTNCAMLNLDNSVLEIITDDGINISNNNIKDILENQNIILKNQNTIMENQNRVIEYQKRMVDKDNRQMANITVLIEDTITKLLTPTTTLANSKPIESEAFVIKPVSNATEFNRLENYLSDKENRQKMILQFVLLFNKVDGSGVNCAYKLLDIMFTKKFLCQCSWSGGSKGQNIKIGFKAYKNILNFFFCLVNSWDLTYTNESNEKFFKTVLKNSVKRAEIKNIRASTKRTRKADLNINNKVPKLNENVNTDIKKDESEDKKDDTVNKMDKTDDTENKMDKTDDTENKMDKTDTKMNERENIFGKTNYNEEETGPNSDGLGKTTEKK